MTTQITIAAAFQSLVNGNTHVGSHGIAGTNHVERAEIWNAFTAAYNESLTIKIKGEVITLEANHSKSGKTTTYFAFISKEAYANIIGTAQGLKKHKMPYITICDGKVQVHNGGNIFVTIENSNIEIL